MAGFPLSRYQPEDSEIDGEIASLNLQRLRVQPFFVLLP
jgi:hypothetical protein